MTRRNSKGMSGHHSATPITTNWATPPHIIAALGGAKSFDLDPCGMAAPPFPIARQTFTRRTGGLRREWFGRVWLNPPYTNATIGRWLMRLADHGVGVALVFARTETEWFCRQIRDRATALLFIEGRLYFHRPDGRRAAANAGAASVLASYGADDRDILAACGLPGLFVPLILPRSVRALFVGTWRQAIEVAFPEGDFTLEDLYRVFASHPKSATNGNVKEKLRQTLARGGFERVDRGRYRRAA